jgi:hypothetical protein
VRKISSGTALVLTLFIPVPYLAITSDSQVIRLIGAINAILLIRMIHNDLNWGRR